MGIADRWNKGGIDWGVDTESFTYVKLEECYNPQAKDKAFVIDGYYMNSKGRYPHGVIINAASKALVDLPSHMNETVKGMLEDPETIQTVKSKKLGFTIYDYALPEQPGRVFYGIRFVDL